ncbi:MAG: hypothetical protein U0V70_00225 [Terriglobia bacterium]
MIWTLIILWMLLSAAFFASLAFLASRPMPSFDESAAQMPLPETQWETEEVVPALAPSHAAAH